MKWIVGFASIVALLTIYSTAFPTSPTAPLATDLPVSHTGDHTPVILNVVERKVNNSGHRIVNADITFTDSAGDAITIVDKLGPASQPVQASNVDILASPAEQIRGFTITDAWECGTNPEIVVETRIMDRAGNLSEPRTITIPCPASQPTNTTTYTLTGLVIGILFVSGAALVFRFRLFKRIPSL